MTLLKHDLQNEFYFCILIQFLIQDSSLTLKIIEKYNI